MALAFHPPLLALRFRDRTTGHWLEVCSDDAITVKDPEFVRVRIVPYQVAAGANTLVKTGLSGAAQESIRQALVFRGALSLRIRTVVLEVLHEGVCRCKSFGQRH